MIARLKRVSPWLGNIFEAVFTVAHGMWVTLRTWIKTYRPDRKTFTEHFEYPEKPVPVAPRYRGFHRFDLTTCIACDQCAKACPVDCIYIGKEKSEGSKGFQITGYTIDYTKCMFCALCVEPCPVDCIYMVPKTEGLIDWRWPQPASTANAASAAQPDSNPQSVSPHG